MIFMYLIDFQSSAKIVINLDKAHLIYDF